MPVFWKGKAKIENSFSEELPSILFAPKRDGCWLLLGERLLTLSLVDTSNHQSLGQENPPAAEDQNFLKEAGDSGTSAPSDRQSAKEKKKKKNPVKHLPKFPHHTKALQQDGYN